MSLVRTWWLSSVSSNNKRYYKLHTGGDSTYLRTAGLIENNEMPLLGVNSDPSRRTGALLNAEIN